MGEGQGKVSRFVLIFDQLPNNRDFNDKLRAFLDGMAGWCRWWEADAYLIDYAGTAKQLWAAADALNVFNRVLVVALADSPPYSGFLRPEAWHWLEKPPGTQPGGCQRQGDPR